MRIVVRIFQLLNEPQDAGDLNQVATLERVLDAKKYARQEVLCDIAER